MLIGGVALVGTFSYSFLRGSSLESSLLNFEYNEQYKSGQGNFQQPPIFQPSQDLDSSKQTMSMLWQSFSSIPAPTQGYSQQFQPSISQQGYVQQSQSTQHVSSFPEESAQQSAQVFRITNYHDEPPASQEINLSDLGSQTPGIYQLQQFSVVDPSVVVTQQAPPGYYDAYQQGGTSQQPPPKEKKRNAANEVNNPQYMQTMNAVEYQASPVYSQQGQLAPEYQTYVQPVQVEYQTYSQPTQGQISAEYQTYSPPMQVEYQTYSQPPQGQLAPEYQTYSQPVQVEYQTYSQPVQVEYQTYSQPVQVEYQTYSQPVQVEYQTYSQPVQVEYETYSQPKQEQLSSSSHSPQPEHVPPSQFASLFDGPLPLPQANPAADTLTNLAQTIAEKNLGAKGIEKKQIESRLGSTLGEKGLLKKGIESPSNISPGLLKQDGLVVASIGEKGRIKKGQLDISEASPGISGNNV